MDYWIDKQILLDRISAWDSFLNKIGEIDLKKLEKRFRETAAYDVSEEKVNKNLEHFLKVLKKEGIKK